MIRRAAITCAVLLAGAAASAQQAGTVPPEFDGGLVDACLAAQPAANGAPESCAGVAADACMNAPGGDTTVGMSWCLGQELDHWDALLNDAYATVMAAARTSDAELAEPGSVAPGQAPLLQGMQRQWIAFRDAACAYEGSRWGGGTGAGPAVTQCALTLTARQFLWLRHHVEAR